MVGGTMPTIIAFYIRKYYDTLLKPTGAQGNEQRITNNLPSLTEGSTAPNEPNQQLLSVQLTLKVPPSAQI